MEGSVGCPIRGDRKKPGTTFGAIDKDHHINLNYAFAHHKRIFKYKVETEGLHYVSIGGGYTPHAETDGDVIYNLEVTTLTADSTDKHDTGHRLANYN